VSKDSVDPSLSCGWAYFVEEHDYKDFLHENVDVAQEVNAVLKLESLFIEQQLFRNPHVLAIMLSTWPTPRPIADLLPLD